MGKTVLDLARSDREIEIAGQCDLGDLIEPAMKNCDVAIDFSQADSIDEICRAALQHGGDFGFRPGPSCFFPRIANRAQD